MEEEIEEEMPDRILLGYEMLNLADAVERYQKVKSQIYWATPLDEEGKF